MYRKEANMKAIYAYRIAFLVLYIYMAYGMIQKMIQFIEVPVVPILSLLACLPGVAYYFLRSSRFYKKIKGKRLIEWLASVQIWFALAHSLEVFEILAPGRLRVVPALFVMIAVYLLMGWGQHYHNKMLFFDE